MLQDIWNKAWKTKTSTCAYQGVRNIRFSENLACFVFLKHPFWYSPFCFITDEIVNLNFQELSYSQWVQNTIFPDGNIFFSILWEILKFEVMEYPIHYVKFEMWTAVFYINYLSTKEAYNYSQFTKEAGSWDFWSPLDFIFC